MVKVEGNKMIGEFSLFDGPDTREKCTVMSKWDVVSDDSRNCDFPTDEDMEEFLQWGRRYRVTIEDLGEIIVDGD